MTSFGPRGGKRWRYRNAHRRAPQRLSRRPSPPQPALVLESCSVPNPPGTCPVENAPCSSRWAARPRSTWAGATVVVSTEQRRARFLFSFRWKQGKLVPGNHDSAHHIKNVHAEGSEPFADEWCLGSCELSESRSSLEQLGKIWRNSGVRLMKSPPGDFRRLFFSILCWQLFAFSVLNHVTARPRSRRGAVSALLWGPREMASAVIRVFTVPDTGTCRQLPLARMETSV